MRRYLTIATVCLAAAALAVAPAFAGKGGNKGNGGANGGGGGGTTSAQITATPNPAAANGTFVLVSGCGFTFAPATLVVTHPLGTDSYSVAMLSTGCLDRTGFYTAEPGTYTVQIYQTFGKHKKTTVLEASTTVTVQ